MGGGILASGQSLGEGEVRDPRPTVLTELMGPVSLPSKTTERQEAGGGARVQQLDQQRGLQGQSVRVWM